MTNFPIFFPPADALLRTIKNCRYEYDHPHPAGSE